MVPRFIYRNLIVELANVLSVLGGDLPIYAFSFIGIALTTWFALVYVPSM